MKRNNRLLSRCAAGLLSLTLALSLIPAAAAAERTVTLSTREELLDFAARCASDTYSKGLTVYLADDIDLGGTAVSVPIFLGTFEGGGHRIRGLALKGSASSYGLFSQVEAGAVVRDLRVEGEVDPDGSQSCVGGIAGENRGTIENCTFSGLVSANDRVGGIAGRNAAGGTISRCTASGIVRGSNYTGGVVGQNAGTVLRCTNSAGVNTNISEETIGAAELAGLESTLYALLKNDSVTETAVTSDTGGIAGYSSGVIQTCSNLGHVGYPHVGYNVGGVVGRQDGYIANCTNRGAVEGRKDVGGIVGQMAPDVTLQLSSDKLEDLRTELDALQSLIDRTLDDAQSTSDTVSARITRISGQADSARESAHDLNRQLSNFADANIDAVNALSLMIDRYVDKAVPITEAVSDGADELVTLLDRTRDMLDTLDGIEEYNDTVLRELRDFCTELEAAGRDLEAAADEMEKAFDLLENDIELPDTTQLRADLKDLLAALVDLNEVIDKAMNEYEDTGSVSAETRDELEDNLRTTFDCLSKVVKDLNDIAQDPDLDGMLDHDLEVLREVAKHFKNAMNLCSDAADHMTDGIAHMRKALDALREINRLLGDAADQLDGVLESAENAAKYFSDALDKAEQWAKDLSEEEPITFTQLGEEYDASSNALNAALTGMSDELKGLNEDLSGANTTLLADARAVNSQFMTVMDLFLDMLEEMGNTQLEDLYEDVSEESLKSAVRGKVLECDNYGEVNADRNAGGVAGAMAIEYDLDPEDDLKQSDRTSQYVYQTRAILMDCRNYGAVTAKKSCGGGIAGRMDLGVIFGCGGYGAVGWEGSDYVGGVCGLSLSSIRSSYAKCSLTGSRYVGGIAGSGSRVSGCISMVEIADEPQQRGAIAGEVTDEYTGNRFVSNVLAGVDRVSLAGKAEQVDYDALCAEETTPSDFRWLTLSFWADGQLLKRLTFRYGESFGPEVYPAAPEQEDCYLRWDREDLTNMRFDAVVTAVYEPYVTALASQQTRADGRALLLVQGQFRAEDSLTVAEEAGGPDLPGGVDLLECWRLTLPEGGSESHTVRWHIPEDAEGSLTVYVNEGDGWKETSAEQIGASLCFTVMGSAAFAVASAARGQVRLRIAVAAGAAVVLAVVLILAVRKRKKARSKRQPAAQKSGK